MTKEIYYRYEDVAYAGMADEWGEYGRGYIAVELREYSVVKYTPCGVWLNIGPTTYGDLHGTKRFVLKTARKRFACPTKEEAMESFLARKRRQAQIYRARLGQAERAIEIAKNLQNV